ncbi:Lrp/AsnC ligand binding domain-containing protein [Aliiroseovarius sp. KMU-50]|uniref:Lrp/AsnC ligand binding domain-containing protein n=1 Tax=Aliiroseovarius salicola TaxID=3009082 RepID=A0ABT4W470_9RHOB|nr:Lrp/AsnC ligand binding domain-containing protein [Aliiroseovarius sp. KMU-50]MDA5095317.1 Lrp/AsnC ligand binding domain-containing protein [Aliiroseovarius sp. KMU-50]
MDRDMAEIGQLDRYDREIMKILSGDGRLPVTELAIRVGLSKTPCQVRLKRLIAEGYIQGFKAMLDPEKLGLDQVVFVEVELTDTTEAALTDFNAAVQAVPEIEQCHMIAGAFDYLLKLRTRDMHSYREVLGRVISALPHVGSTSTHVSMQSVKDDAF